MKPDRIIIDEADKTEIRHQIPDKTSVIFKSVIPFRGHTMFQIDCTNGEIKPAKFTEVNVNFDGGVKKKILVNPNCLYISCLNEKSARKKYHKWILDRTIKLKK